MMDKFPDCNVEDAEIAYDLGLFEDDCDQELLRSAED